MPSSLRCLAIPTLNVSRKRMELDTKSEELFAAICGRHSYEVTKLPTRSDEYLKTADFSALTPYGRIVAEIEELSPNPDDLRQIKEMKETGITHGGGTIGVRARRAIRHASIQLSDHSNEQVPLIAVLYDNVRTLDGRVAYPLYYLEPHHIDAAMYGQRVVHVALRGGVTPHSDRSGGGRTTTPNEKNYLSAVAIISDWDDKKLFVYHNCFADYPLPVEVFSDHLCHHLKKGSDPCQEPWQWHAATGANRVARGI